MEMRSHELRGGDCEGVEEGIGILRLAAALVVVKVRVSIVGFGS